MLSFDYDEIDEIGSYGYDWYIGMIIRRKSDGQLFWGVTSGCSCNWWGDAIEDGDLTPVESWQDAVELAKLDFSDAEIYTLANRLRNSP